jgi:hypothetical protein
MNYLDGQAAQLGDVVDLGGGMQGVVVCCLDEGLCMPGFAITDWSELKAGVLVKSEQAGLIHYREPDVDLVLLRRGLNPP